MKQIFIKYVRDRLSEKSTKLAIAAMLAAALGGGAELMQPSEALTSGGIALLLALLPTSKLPTDTSKSPVMVGLVAVGLLFLLGACGPNVSILKGFLADVEDPQNQAGLVLVDYKFCENSAGGFDICGAAMVDGKEQAKVDLDWAINQDGTMSIKYNATDSRAFQAFATRAELQKALGQSLGTNVFDALQGIINPASGAAGALAGPD